MKKYLTLIQGVVLGVAGIVISLLGWAEGNLKWILPILSCFVLVGSVAIFLIQQKRAQSSDEVDR